MVVKFIKRVEAHVAPKLKPIRSLVYESLISPARLKSADNLHMRYGYGLNDILFYLLPPFPLRKQTLPPLSFLPASTAFTVKEYIVSIRERPQVYLRLAKLMSNQNRSLLLICPTASAAENLSNALSALSPVLVPSGSDKAEREFYIDCYQHNNPRLFIGTRGALKTPLDHLGAVIIDEPWLPAHKEDNNPKLWSCLIAQELCKAQGIPLYLFSSLPWPDSQLLKPTKRYFARSEPKGELRITPKRPLGELLTQFLANSQDEQATAAIIIRESHREVLWCSVCRSLSPSPLCPTCHKPASMLPKLTKESIAEHLHSLDPGHTIAILSADELHQFRYFHHVLALNFDVFLSIIDFRSTLYTATLIALLRAQSQTTDFVTTHPDIWTNIIHKDRLFFTTTELNLRKTHDLPPFTLAVQLKSKQKPLLEEITSQTIPGCRKIGRIRNYHDEYMLPLVFDLDSTPPIAWFRKANFKVDILPNYVE